MMFLLVLAVFCLAGAAFLVGEIATLPARQRSLSVRRAASYGRMEMPSGTPQENLSERLLVPMREWLAAWVLKVNPRMSLDSVGNKLLAAGLGRTLSPNGFLAAKGLVALSGVFLGTLIGAGKGPAGIVLGAVPSPRRSGFQERRR